LPAHRLGVEAGLFFFGFISQHDPVEGLQPGYFSPSIGNMQGALANADGAIMMMTAMPAII
jgi:hypothetical protein